MMKIIKLESQTSPCFGKDLKQGQNDYQAGWHVKEKVKVLMMTISDLDN